MHIRYAYKVCISGFMIKMEMQRYTGKHLEKAFEQGFKKGKKKTIERVEETMNEFIHPKLRRTFLNKIKENFA